ncbi:aldehyde dehydrogenase family protein [Aliamphritea ceti]|uniref:aldehyde dehydrogenase family protein n=1 Tax=Aliamphritea ceti TaxID=1524258 RepID=UPI0021C36918|nr:aldehyde dehydrogenase family protein [Aliamphritea ceti]
MNSPERNTSEMDAKVKSYLQQYQVSNATLEFLNRQHEHFIDGHWSAGSNGSRLEVLEPSTGGMLTTISQGSAQDVDRAVSAARAQFDGGEWSRLKPLERETRLHKLVDVLQEHALELAEIESIDVGKSVNDASQIDIQGTIDTFRYFAGWASKISGRTGESSLPGEYVAYTRKEAVGVVGSIIPWNFPLQTMAWKLGAALAVGCTVVVKPSEITSLSALRFAELAKEAGIPDGVINIVTGLGEEVGAAMSSHSGIDKVTFTGSTKVGITVGNSALQSMKHMTLELGGKSPVIVFDDVDLKQTAEAVANGIFFNSGQVCDAGSRAYIHHSIYDRFLTELIKYTKQLKIASGLNPECFIGPMVSARQQETVMKYIEAGQTEGAELVCGGKTVEGSGFFVEPTIFANCRNDMAVVREEIFGPVLVTAPFETEEEVIDLANDSIYGLAAAIYSNSLSRVHRVIPKLKAGSVYVNGHGTIDPAMPFGGYKQSGVGKDLGAEQLEYFLETKAVWITLT